ncbi:MAG TPA: xanthine dehydrogenase family protein molybdopterin-binding subunit [Longimicrobiales bacterium]|nr:xanthine dehydrogenase family protein molybdopterin-binding subunit [Longimicrobiales bacterium]
MSAPSITGRAIGAPLDRLDGPAKVTGTARYAFEQRVHRPAYVYPLEAAIAVGRVTRIDASAAAAEPGVLAVLTSENAPKLASTEEAELVILQGDDVAYRGQFVGGVIAETPEIARHAARLVRLEYEERPHDVELRADRDDLYAPEHANAGYATDSIIGDVDAALAAAAVTIDATYTTPAEFNNPMEPHSTVAIWRDEGLTVYAASQGVHRLRQTLASTFGLDPDRVRVISPHVGGGFGSKAYTHADAILAAMAARLTGGRPVKLALTRQQMFWAVGFRTPTIQRLRLGADADGRLTAIAHDVVEETARIVEFTEQTAAPSRIMYAAPQRRTTHRLARLDVPPPTIMRAPGVTPGMFGLESAMDELAVACGVDPIELRIRNEPERDPESGQPFSSRNLVACLREGARRFGWERRDPTPRARRAGRWLVGTGVAASTYPVHRSPDSTARIRAGADGRCVVSIGAADIGTGTWTTLTQIAADALGIPVDDVVLEIGDTALPYATTAGGSTGINNWGAAIVEAARRLRERLDSEFGGVVPAGGLEVASKAADNPYPERFSMHSFGAQFVEVRVDEDTGEIRVARLLGIFAAGRAINPKTAGSQLLGGMAWGLSMALHENGVRDARFGHVVNHDFAEYHVPTNADVGAVEVGWVEEEDPYVNPMGSKGIGELGICGTAAAVANAVYHATGIRVRDLPITLDKLLR